MIRIACLLDRKDGVIAESYAAAEYVVLIDAETGDFLKEFARDGLSDVEFARRLVKEDPEAVITGGIEQGPFEILAEEAYITRYDGVGLAAPEAIRLMNAYRLKLIPDFIGGTGCHSGGECHEHH